MKLTVDLHTEIQLTRPVAAGALKIGDILVVGAYDDGDQIRINERRELDDVTCALEVSGWPADRDDPDARTASGRRRPRRSVRFTAAELTTLQLVAVPDDVALGLYALLEHAMLGGDTPLAGTLAAALVQLAADAGFHAVTVDAHTAGVGRDAARTWTTDSLIAAGAIDLEDEGAKLAPWDDDDDFDAAGERGPAEPSSNLDEGRGDAETGMPGPVDE